MNTFSNLLARALTVMNERIKGMNTATRVGSLFRDILLFFKSLIDDLAASIDILAVTKADKSIVDALVNGVIKQPTVNTYNTGANSLAAIYGLTANNNGSNGKVKQNGWDVLVKVDETKGGVSNRYNWNGSMWVDMETGIYDDKIRTNGYLLAGNTKVEVTLTKTSPYELTIVIPAFSRVLAKNIDITTPESVTLQKTINNPVYFYYNISTETFGLLDVANISSENTDFVILGFITRLANQIPLINCAWWTYNGIEQKHKSSIEINEYNFLHPDSEFISFPHGAILDFVQYTTAKVNPEKQYYIQYIYNMPTRYLIQICDNYKNQVAVSFLPTTNLTGDIQWMDLYTNDTTKDLFGRVLVDPSKIPTESIDFGTKFHLRSHPKVNTALPYLFDDSAVNAVIRDSILEFKQLPTAIIEPSRQYYLRYIYNMPEGSNPNARFLLMVCDQNMNERARCFIDGTYLEGVQWIDMIDDTTKVPFARVLVDPSKMPTTSIDYGKNLHLRLIPTNSAINESEYIVWFGDSVMANRSTIPAKTGAMLGIPVDQCAVGGSRFSEREQTNTESTKWHKLDMCILVDAIVSGDFTAQEEAAQWLADNVHIDFLYIVNMIAKLKTIDFSTKTIVIFSFGTNDFTGLNLLGDKDSTDIKTVRGAIKYIIDKLIAAYPNLKVYFTSPTHRYFQSDLQQSSDVVPNSKGLYLIEYVDAIKDQVNLLHYPMLDMYRESGLNKYNHTRYFADGVHPNAVGNEYFARLISAYIKSKINF